MTDINANAATYFVDRHLAEGRADKLVYTEASGQQRTLTYGALAAQTDQIAALFAFHDIRREDRVAMLVLDQIEWPIAFWGALKCGVVPVPLNTLLATDVYDTILRDSRASALILSAEMWSVVSPCLADNPYLRAVYVIGDTPDGTLDFNALRANCPATPAIPVSPDECAFWLYSSGSTGAPKGVRHVHSAVRATAETYGAQVLGITQQDVVYSAAKFFFAYGFGNAAIFPMSVGASTVLFDGRPTPEKTFEILNTYQPTIFCGVPTLYAALCARLSAGETLDVALRRCVSAGEALPEEIGKTWSKHTGCDILDGVGSTEMLHIFLSNSPDDVVYGTSGIAVPGYQVALVDDAGLPVRLGDVGEMIVKGASAAQDYWNKRTKSRKTFEGEWTRTGDKYTQNEDGRFVYCGRTDDMFKVSGIWLSPFEVEQSLVAHSSVLEAAVVAHRDHDGLEKPRAFVVLQKGADPDVADDLKIWVKDQIGKWKYPRWIEIVDTLPKTATGKIQRFKLRNI